MIDELILHIGMPKTGTTSIQRALNAVRGGADWTYLDLNPPHSANPVILRAHGGIAPVSVHPGPRGAQSPQAAHAHLTHALKSVRTPRAILSAEVMMRLPPAAVASLLDHLSQHARSIRAIAYIRPPLSFITSYVQQFYKTGHAPLADVLRRAQRPITADAALWDHALGREHVHFLPFARETFLDGSVVQHFAETLQLGPLPEQKQNANVSLSDEATRLMVQFRRHHPVRHPNDGRILHRLSKLRGSPFRLHAECLAQAQSMANATYAWAEERMKWEMCEGSSKPSPRAIREDADFQDILPETLNWLSEQTSCDATQLQNDPEAIAKAVSLLRDRPTGQSTVGRLARRLRLA